MTTRNLTLTPDWYRCAMDGLSFTTLSETPCAEPHAGCCGDWGLDTPGYPISELIAI